MKKLIAILMLIPILGMAQNKKTLDHDDFSRWRSISSESISNNGAYITYSTESNAYGNPAIKLHAFDGATILSHDRASNPVFTNDSKHLVFKVSPDFELVKELKRKKTKDKDIPGDTLALYDIASKGMTKVGGLQSFKVPKKWDDYLIYLYEPPADTANKKAKKRSKKNGYDLVVKNLRSAEEYTFPYVTDYAIPEEGKGLIMVTTGNDSTIREGVYRFDFSGNTFNPIFRSKGEYYRLAWDNQGTKASFISDTDTTKTIKRDYHLHLILNDWDSTKTIARSGNIDGLIVNKDFTPYFSESGRRLFFEIKDHPVKQDTAALDEDIVDVEVWNYKDQRLFTDQENDKSSDQRFGYLSYYDVANERLIQLGGSDYSDVMVSDEGDGATALAESDYNYRMMISWEGYSLSDLYEVDLSSGEKTKIAEAVRGSFRLSPKGKYAYWYDQTAAAWFTYAFADKKIRQVTTNNEVAFYNEIHDSPSDPWPYGLMSWTENDDKMLIYDRYDIWEVDPKAAASAKRITPDGRSQRLTYRYIRLDDEERFIKKGQDLMLSGFYESDKSEGIFSFTYGKSGAKKLMGGDYRYASFEKARDSKQLLFTQESFEVFPDLRSSTTDLKKTNRISDVNPEQKEYNWGTIELVKWTSLDGIELEGMLVKPENFDPSKKYPLMVNFYEKSADGINRHRAPYPHRSTMNYSFYASRGYVIFNPNVHYKIGYPGESAFNCVIPGVNALIEKGFIDKENIGVQGHSWGGYQIAYLIAKTDIFKCAEAGAPVVNMISAYGGIRWGSGLSRMFQYERTQSRIGGTLWEYPLRYMENSPIFVMDKVNTPVLIMHNDEDGAVPWYQGIEYFVALRRLGKPAWMLNYRGEPHWPLKLQNRLDFNLRLSQFFDYYLKGEPMPKWMRDGVPALETGINQGYELLEDKDD